ncbi:hypothetical protein EDD22DRAFT_986712 [Suillus occidentalis]|nr:hypothetical protein EDD22DRAFT_986712 [Suillus occidentalis]
MTKEGKVVDKWLGKAVIKSFAKLSYTDAQSYRRSHDGAVSLSSKCLEFTLDESGCKQTNLKNTDANSIVEEFMLLTNTTVAQRIAIHLPEQARLRRHDTPLERRLNLFNERANRLNIAVDVSSSGAIIEAIANPTARMVLELISYKATQRAKYFCAGMFDIAKYNHYVWLSVPLYIHFTLQSGATRMFLYTVNSNQFCRVERNQDSLWTVMPWQKLLNFATSKVVGIIDAAFDVLVPEFGIEKRVHTDQMPIDIDSHVYDEHEHTLKIYWLNRDVLSWLAENSDDEHLKKVKQNAEAHAVKMEFASRSVHDEKALFHEDDADEDEIVLGREWKLKRTWEEDLLYHTLNYIKEFFERTHTVPP